MILPPFATLRFIVPTLVKDESVSRWTEFLPLESVLTENKILETSAFIFDFPQVLIALL